AVILIDQYRACGGILDFAQQLAKTSGIGPAGRLDVGQVRFCQTQSATSGMNRMSQTGWAGEDVALGSNNVEYHELAVVAAQPWQQAGPQERRLSCTRCAEHNKQCFHPRRTHPAQRVETANQLG